MTIIFEPCLAMHAWRCNECVVAKHCLQLVSIQSRAFAFALGDLTWIEIFVSSILQSTIVHLLRQIPVRYVMDRPSMLLCNGLLPVAFCFCGVQQREGTRTGVAREVSHRRLL